MKKFILLFCLTLNMSQFLFGQEDTASVTYISSSRIYLLQYTYNGITYEDTLVPATKINPIVNCTVVKESNTGRYLYAYIVSLLTSSEQYLVWFAVDYFTDIQQEQKPTNRWHIFDYGRLNRIDWSNSNIDTTGLHTDTTDIGPGSSLGGFSYKSNGLPTIVCGYFEGNAPGLAFTGEPPAKMEELLAPILNFPNNTIIRKTLGPKLPPSPINSLYFLDTLKSYVTQSRTLSWITTDAAKNKYITYFDSARAQLLRDTTGKLSRGTLVTVLQNANQDSLGLLSSEAYALIRYNTEYLIEHLPGVITLPSSIMGGWNMISLPVDAASKVKSELYSTSTSNAFMFSNGYVAKDTIQNGIGYWLKFGANDTLIYKGFQLDSLSIPVTTGWNMIGSISSNCNRSKIKAENTEVVSNFFNFQNGYVVDTVIIPGKSYWVKVSQNGTLILNKTAQSGGGGSYLPPPPPGAPGIPTLSSPSNGAVNQPRTITLSWEDSPNALTYRLQVSTSSSFSTLIFDDSTITATSKLFTGLAHGTTYYWRVNAKNAIWTSEWSGVFWFRTQGSSPLPDPCQPIDALSAMDQFTVSDANGNNQQLFVYNAGKKLALGIKDFEMPPEPIEGVFHAKFHSGKFAENVPLGQAKKQLKIKVRDAKYPLTITWDIKPESKTSYWLYKNSKDKISITGIGSINLNSTDANTIQVEVQAIQPVPCY